MTTEQERHEAAYMEAVRSTVVKITYGGSGGKTLSLKEINAQINELLKASIQSQGVISLFDSKKADENISLFDPCLLYTSRFYYEKPCPQDSQSENRKNHQGNVYG